MFEEALTVGGAPGVVLVVGTRPEAIKLLPVAVPLFRTQPERLVVLCTGQHRAVLEGWPIELQRRAQVLDRHSARLGPLDDLQAWFGSRGAGLCVVQGDTRSAYHAAVAARGAGIAVAHVEAGLRTHDLRSPWPEELFRIRIARIAALHFAPTARAEANLRREGVRDGAIDLVGNTVVDALKPWLCLPAGARGTEGRRVIVTIHRRESISSGAVGGLARAVVQLALRHPALEWLCVTHPNRAFETGLRALAAPANLRVSGPLARDTFVDLLRASTLVMTDSGGVQEEAAVLGVPALILREKSERVEAVEAGASRLVGVEPERVVRETTALLSDPAQLDGMRDRARSVFGDGHAGERIARRLMRYLNPAALAPPPAPAPPAARSRASADARAAGRRCAPS